MIFFISWSGVWLSPLGTSPTNCSIVPVPDDRWVWSIWWNENWQGKPKYLKKTCASDTLSTTHPTWPGLWSNLGRRDGKPATNRLSYGTALIMMMMRLRMMMMINHLCVSPVLQLSSHDYNGLSSYFSQVLVCNFFQSSWRKFPSLQNWIVL
jgi:hypothetical protein